jgi:DNA polymerase III delta subunit
VKFNRATAFEKHLLEAKKEHLAPVYLLAIPDAYERKRMAEQVAARIGFFYPDGTFTTKEAVPIVHLLDELNTISLFEKSRIVFYDSIQSIRKEDLNSLTRYFTNPASSTFLLLGISHAKTAQEIYMEGKKDLISCDFTEEKPWDRKERLKN